MKISMWMGTSRPLALAYYTHRWPHSQKLLSRWANRRQGTNPPRGGGDRVSEVGPHRRRTAEYYLTSVVRVSCVIESVRGIVWSIYCQSFLKHDSWLLQNMQDRLHTQKVNALGLKNTEGIRANVNISHHVWNVNGSIYQHVLVNYSHFSIMFSHLSLFVFSPALSSLIKEEQRMPSWNHLLSAT